MRAMAMTIHSLEQTSETMLERIDLMMRELQALREVVLSLRPEQASQVTKQLLGSLGNAVPGELDQDADIYMQLFDQ